eukprot:CAMPEP_0184643446 /NCGR_PEP_ID=MMETSP0308-20130426/283_1 /TAXON_ID=38269 /ORGANISM="Gloeochaete witrockiana, Strain SAG 46.84" /LENGTH=582 /DNA_ID=CAMNT_0027071381 /DNA_START=123 /DNA_END=1871 /DNA_ORIENTATION=+
MPASFTFLESSQGISTAVTQVKPSPQAVMEILSSKTLPESGTAVLRDPFKNKILTFSEEERDQLKIRGLVPPVVTSPELEEERVLNQLSQLTRPIDKYVHLRRLQDVDETLFYRVLINNIYDLMPLVYTPVVGEACQKFGEIYLEGRGLYITINDKGRVRSLLDNWPEAEVQAIVVTDGERILGLGDLGAYGMGIPVGKLSLYTACAGIHPQQTLPVTIDVGTNNTKFLEDKFYTGLRHRRVQGPEYDALIAEFIDAVKEKWGPTTLIQFEDFANQNAFRLLETYREKACVFNDDIQGTSSVTLAGLLSAMRLVNAKMRDVRFLCLGAGEAGTGICDLVSLELATKNGISIAEARKQCWLVDSKGLVVQSRKNELQEHKLHYAHDFPRTSSLIEAVHALKPHVLIGVAAVTGAFNKEVIDAMCKYNERPVIFALSNPTSKCECTAEEAYKFSNGKAVFATGSPFDPVELNGKTYVTGQANNAYIFPGVGLGILACKARHVTDEMFIGAAEAVAQEVTEADLSTGCVFPPLSSIRDVSLKIAVRVAAIAFDSGLATVPRPDDIEALCRSAMYEPVHWSLRSKL